MIVPDNCLKAVHKKENSTCRCFSFIATTNHHGFTVTTQTMLNINGEVPEGRRPDPPKNGGLWPPRFLFRPGLPWRCPPSALPRCVFTSGGRSRSSSAGGDGEGAGDDGRPPSIRSGRCAGRRGMKVRRGAGGPQAGLGVRRPPPGRRGPRCSSFAVLTEYHFQKLLTSRGMRCRFSQASPDKGSVKKKK